MACHDRFAARQVMPGLFAGLWEGWDPTQLTQSLGGLHE